MRRDLIRTLTLLALAAVVPACGGGGGGGGAAIAVLLASESATGVDGNGNSDQQHMSSDGRYIVFRSAATNLIDGSPETLGNTDVYRKDMSTGAILRVSRTSAGAEPNGASGYPSISADGNYVAYSSTATDIVAGATANTNVYLYDVNANTTILISDATTAGVQNADGNSDFPAVTVNGANIFVAYQSAATNLAAGATGFAGGEENIFRGTVTVAPFALTGNILVSHSTTANTVGDNPSTRPTISSDGNLIAFQSTATNLVAGDTNGMSDIFVRNVTGDSTTRASLDTTEGQLTGSAAEGATKAMISSDGLDVVFLLTGTNIAVNGIGDRDIWIRTNWASGAAGETLKVSDHATANTSGATCDDPAVNQDGTYVVWHSATLIVNGDTNGMRDVFRRVFVPAGDFLDRVSLTAAGAQTLSSPAASTSSFFRPALSSNGAFVCFDTNATDLISPAPSAFRHIYRRG